MSNNKVELQRSMKSRHLFMISIGGVIGTGLFLNSGHVINEAGPGGAILAYILVGFLVYLVMLCLGELTVSMPVTGSFQTYASKYIGPSTGFTVGWMYWLNWAVTVSVELTAVGLLMQRWFPDIPVWIWCGVFGISLFVINSLSTRSFAETEFWFSSIKIVTILLFIVVGTGIIFGFFDMGETKNSVQSMTTMMDNGGLFPNGFSSVFFTMIGVVFSFQGTELIGIAAGESENPEKEIPKAIKNTIWRTVFFYVISMLVLVSLIPWQKAGSVNSPFVYIFDHVGIPYAADIMNFVILTAVLSVANSGLYASTRMLWAMSQEGLAGKSFTKLSKKGVPIRALSVTFLIACLSLLTSFIAADTVFLILVSIAGFAGIFVWMLIALSQFKYRKAYISLGNDINNLKFRTPLFPFVPIMCFILCLIVIISMAFVESLREALFCGIPFVIGCYVYYYLRIHKKPEEQNEDTILKTSSGE
ncbi:amino acid permease [Bacillus megaterium]|nr:amino acid permease [Priestia megaterium]